MILVLTDQFDKHADVVIEKLNSLDLPTYRLNLDTESLQKTQVTFDSQQWSVNSDKKQLYSQQIDCVWLRRPFVELTLQEQNNIEPDFKIWRGEWNKTLLGFYTSIRHLPWLNHIRDAYRAENKYLQMEVASQVGLKMPPTLVSNCKEQLLAFARQYDQVALKLMNQEFYQDGDGNFKGIYVNILTVNDLKEFGDFQENPIVLQSYIPKSFEVRYTVVGTDHHVCRIDSQLSSKTRIDWRRYDIPRTPHIRIEPPPEIRQKVNALLKALDISFGAIDFIVSPSEEWYFLEVNAMGQWLWIEELTNLKISDSIVNWLIQSRKERQP